MVGLGAARLGVPCPLLPPPAPLLPLLPPGMGMMPLTQCSRVEEGAERWQPREQDW